MQVGPKPLDLTSILVCLIGHTQLIYTRDISYANLFSININSRNETFN